MKRLTDWYAHPRYYEAIFGGDSAKEMDFLLEVNRRFGTGGRRWLEPACGAGRLLLEGARRGLRLTGYDVSERMLDYARARLRRAGARVSLHRARMEEFCPPGLRGRFDLAFNLVSTFRYLDSEEAALSHLLAVRALLKPGGLYVLGFHVTEYERRSPEHERWVGRAGRATVVCNTHEWPPDPSRRLARMRNRLRISGGGEDALVETEWYFRTYSPAEAIALVRRAGFALTALFTFDYDLDAPVDAATDRLDWVMVLCPGGFSATR